MSLSQPLSQALTPKKTNLAPALLLIIGLVIALGAAAYGYLESRRTERVIIAVRSIPFGQPITADDLGTIELPLHRPIQLAGMSNPNLVIGQWAAREIGPNDIVQSSMLLNKAPDQPVYPSGQQLGKNMVPLPFAIATIGPLTYRDTVNIGYNDPRGDPALCQGADGAAAAAPAATTDALGRPYACRLLQQVKVLHVDADKGIAYLEVTPYQAHAIWALQAAGLQLWGERYGATSDPLPALDRLDVSQIALDKITASMTNTLLLDIPGSAAATTTSPAKPSEGSALPGDSPIPGQAQPTAAPVAKP